MNWLTIAVIVFLAVLFLIGWLRGIISTLVSIAMLVLTFVIVAAIHTPLSNVISDHTGMDEAIHSATDRFVEKNVTGRLTNLSSAGIEGQIDALDLPDVISDYLKESAGKAGLTGQSASARIQAFLTDTLSRLVFSAAVYAISYIAAAVLTLILALIIKALFKLPGLKQVNQLAGGIAGLVMGVLLLWVGAIIVTAGSSASWGQEAMRMINESPVLSWLYNNNLLLKLTVKS